MVKMVREPMPVGRARQTVSEHVARAASKQAQEMSVVQVEMSEPSKETARAQQAESKARLARPSS